MPIHSSAFAGSLVDAESQREVEEGRKREARREAREEKRRERDKQSKGNHFVASGHLLVLFVRFIGRCTVRGQDRRQVVTFKTGPVISGKNDTVREVGRGKESLSLSLAGPRVYFASSDPLRPFLQPCEREIESRRPRFTKHVI